MRIDFAHICRQSACAFRTNNAIAAHFSARLQRIHENFADIRIFGMHALCALYFSAKKRFCAYFSALYTAHQKSEGPHQSAHPASVCRKPTLFSAYTRL